MSDFNAALSQLIIEELSPELRTIVLSGLAHVPRSVIDKLEELQSAPNALDLAYSTIGSMEGQGAWGINALKEGKRIFQNFKSDFQQKLCSYPPLRTYCENARTIDAFAVAGIVAGGLLEHYTHGIDVPSAALIISRLGIDSFCQTEWQATSEK